MKALTERQAEVLQFIIRYQDQYGFPPTLKEIMEEFGFKSPRTASGYLEALEKKGAIRVHRGKVRAIEILQAPARGIPLVGRIPTGFPEEPFEEVEERLPVDPDFFGPGVKFAVRVRGDSMEGAGIRDGDLAVIRQQPEAEDGQIVAALVDGEVTLKRLKKGRGGRVELRPENPAYEPLVFEPPEEPRILGVMVGLIRRSR